MQSGTAIRPSKRLLVRDSQLGSTRLQQVVETVRVPAERRGLKENSLLAEWLKTINLSIAEGDQQTYARMVRDLSAVLIHCSCPKDRFVFSEGSAD